MNNSNQEKQYIRAKKRVDKIRGFYSHTTVYVIINSVLLILLYNGYENKMNFWNIGSFSTAIGWGVGLLLHGIVVFKNKLSFVDNWEQKKMEQFLKEEEQNTNKWE